MCRRIPNPIDADVVEFNITSHLYQGGNLMKTYVMIGFIGELFSLSL